MLADLIFLAAMGVLNRIRGGGLGGQHLPGRAVLWVAPTICVLASALVMPLYPVLAGLWALTYLTWGIPPWGRLYDLHRLDGIDTRPPSAFERFLLEVTGGSDHLAFFLRHLITILPGAILIAAWLGNPFVIALGFIMAGALVLAYEAAWTLHERNPIWVAEIIGGGIWGGAIIYTALL